MTESLSQTHGKQKWAKKGTKDKGKLLAAIMAKERALWTEGLYVKGLDLKIAKR